LSLVDGMWELLNRRKGAAKSFSKTFEGKGRGKGKKQKKRQDVGGE